MSAATRTRAAARRLGLGDLAVTSLALVALYIAVADTSAAVALLDRVKAFLAWLTDPTAPTFAARNPA